MIIIKTQEEAEKLVNNGKIYVEEDISFECDIKLPDVDIGAAHHDICAKNIECDSITGYFIKCDDIKTSVIVASFATTKNISAINIYIADKLKSLDIRCNHIRVGDIKAREVKCLTLVVKNHVEAHCTNINGRRQVKGQLKEKELFC